MEGCCNTRCIQTEVKRKNEKIILHDNYTIFSSMASLAAAAITGGI